MGGRNDVYESLDHLGELLKDELIAHGFVGLVSLSGNGYEVSPLSVTEVLSKDLFGDVLNGTLRFLCHDAELMPYESGFRPSSHQACTLDVGSSDEIEAFSTAVLDSLNVAQYFCHDDESIERLKFHGFIAQIDENNVVASVRLITPKKELGKSRWFGLTFSGGAYNKVDDRTFLLDEKADFVLFDSAMYVLNGVAFERLFGQVDNELLEIEAKLDRIIKYIPIQNSDEFVDACSRQFQMRSKIRSIASKDYLENVTIDDIKHVVSEFNLDVQIHEDKLVFDSHRSRRWQILKLLDDDFLGSRMTGVKYEVNSKSSRA